MEPSTSRTATHRRPVTECESGDEDMEVDRIDAYIQKITKKDVPESDRKLRSQNKEKSVVSKPLKAKEKTE